MKLEEHVRRINALTHKHAKGEDKQEQYLISIGRHVAAIKEEYPDTWEAIVEERCQIKRTRAYDLMAIGDGTSTVEKLRLAAAERKERFNKKRKEREESTGDDPFRNGQPDVEDVEENAGELEADDTADDDEPAGVDPSAMRQLVRFEIFVSVGSIHEIDIHTGRPGSGRQDAMEQAVEEFCAELRRKRLKREARQRQKYELAMGENRNRDEQHLKYNMAMAEKRAQERAA